MFVVNTEIIKNSNSVFGLLFMINAMTILALAKN